MGKTIDAKGLECPKPVILTKKALETANDIIVIVDNLIAKENVSRMAKSQGCSTEVTEKEGHFHIHLTKNEGKTFPKEESLATTNSNSGEITVLVQQDIMGRGDEKLGNILIRGFMHTLTEISPLPHKIIFYNTGVKLTIEDSPVLEDLKALEEKGINMLVCGTCLNYFNITDKLQVGIISNMYDIAESLTKASKVITI